MNPRLLPVDADPVDVPEIARRLGVAASTVRAWISRDPTFPPTRWLADREARAGTRNRGKTRTGLWDWNLDIVPWLKATNRWKEPTT